MVRAPAFSELLAATKRSAVHLEMRDGYMATDPVYTAWRAGNKLDPAKEYEAWVDLVSGATRRGVQICRARIVSEPVSDYVRFEYEITDAVNTGPGEQVRWLPRARASDLALPGNDFWLFDNEVVRWNHFNGDGEWAGDEISEDAAHIRLCSTAFEAVWERAISHLDYEPV